MKLYAAGVALAWISAFCICDDVGAQESVSIKLSLADLDLATESGWTSAQARVASTAARLCRQFENEEKVDHRETLADCIHDAKRDALTQLEQQVKQARDSKASGS